MKATLAGGDVFAWERMDDHGRRHRGMVWGVWMRTATTIYQVIIMPSADENISNSGSVAAGLHWEVAGSLLKGEIIIIILMCCRASVRMVKNIFLIAVFVDHWFVSHLIADYWHTRSSSMGFHLQDRVKCSWPLWWIILGQNHVIQWQWNRFWYALWWG